MFYTPYYYMKPDEQAQTIDEEELTADGQAPDEAVRLTDGAAQAADCEEPKADEEVQTADGEEPKAEGEERKTIDVVAAVICQKDTFLATQKGAGEYEGQWEFPGGKIEPGEVPTAAIRREISEELGVDIQVKHLLCTVIYNYPAFRLTMRCYLCRIVRGTIELREHASARWLKDAELDSVDWLPADRLVVRKLKQKLRLKAAQQEDEQRAHRLHGWLKWQKWLRSRGK